MLLLVFSLLVTDTTLAANAANPFDSASNLATLRSKRFFSSLFRELDVPLAGRRVWPKLLLIDGPCNSAMDNKGNVVVTTGLLSRYSGISVDSSKPATIDRAIRVLEKSPARRAQLSTVIGHELGHHQLGHLQLPEGALREGFRNVSFEELKWVTERMVGTLSDQQRAEKIKSLQALYTQHNRAAEEQQILTEQARKTGSLKRAFDLLKVRCTSRVKNDPGLSKMVVERGMMNGLLHTLSSPKLHQYLDRPVKIYCDNVELSLQRRSDGTVEIKNLDDLLRIPALAHNCAKVKEFMADEHGLSVNQGSLKHRLEGILRINSKSTWMEQGGDHPATLARLLNLVFYVKKNPSLFSDQLRQPLHLRVYRDLPALKISYVDGRVKVWGFKALYKRLPAAEQQMLRKYQRAKTAYQHNPSVQPGHRRPERVLNGQRRNLREGALRRSVDRLIDRANIGQSRIGTLRLTTNRLARTANSLLAIMIARAVFQYHEQGSVDFGAAVTQTLDSTEVWAGMAATGLLQLATPNLTLASSTKATASSQQFFRSSFMRRMFGKTLRGCRSSMFGLGVFTIVSAYVREASEGINADGQSVSFSTLLSNKDGKGSLFWRNLGRICASPKAHGSILKSVFRDELLTCRFAFSVIGCTVGAKLGALATAFAVTKISAVLGLAVGGPVGAVVMGVLGFTGSAIAGAVGMIGMSLLGDSIGTSILSYRYNKSIERLESQLQAGAKKNRLKSTLEHLSKLREQYANRLLSRFSQALNKLAAKEEDTSERSECRESLQKLREKIQDLYLVVMVKLVRALHVQYGKPSETKSLLEAENVKLMAEVTLLTSRLDALEAAAIGSNENRGSEASANVSPTDEQFTPNFNGFELAQELTH